MFQNVSKTVVSSPLHPANYVILFWEWGGGGGGGLKVQLFDQLFYFSMEQAEIWRWGHFLDADYIFDINFAITK